MRAAFFLSLGLVMLGSCGVTRGVGLASNASASPISPVEGGSPALAAAQAKLFEIEQDIFLGTPRRRALGVADVIVSMMLVIGSFLLVTRSSATEWWVKNAVAANVLVLWVITGATLAHAYAKRADVLSALAELARASDPARTPDAATVAAVARGSAYLGLGSVLLVTLVVTFVHLYLAYRVTRDDVREFLASPPAG